MHKGSEEIDRIFRERFHGLKDNSISPQEGWEKFNALYVSPLAKSSATVRYMSWKSAFGMAATVAIMAVIGSSDPKVGSPGYGKQNQQQVNSPDQTLASSARQPATVQNQRVEGLNAGPKPVEVDHIVDAADNASYSELPAIASSVDIFATDQHADVVTGEVISLMPSISSALTGSMASMSEVKLPELLFTPSKHQFFVRFGVQVTNGESNSAEKPNLWSTDGFIGLGYSYALTKALDITSEFGWMRRNGNAIERSREIENKSVNNAIYGNYQLSGYNTADEVIVTESVVASMLQFIHFPLSLDYNYRNAKVSIGAYGDYLFSARNETYMVYNGTEYVQNSIKNDVSDDLSGLNRFRYGLRLGAEKSLKPGLSFAGYAMMPLNKATTHSDAYSLPGAKAMNQLISLQFGVKYNI